MLASELPDWAIRALAFLFGAIWGSFFNVAIYRWPRDMSVVTPGSHCPGCEKPVPGHHNIPLVSYLVLRGKAACCGAKLSPRYFVVELLSAVVCLAIAEQLIVAAADDATLLDVSIEALLYFILAGGLLVATFTDLEGWEIPDQVTLPGTALGLLTVTLREAPGAEQAALGAGAGYLIIQIVLVWGWKRLTGRQGMGEGDALLLMMIGAFVGFEGAIFCLVAGTFQGIAVALIAGLVFVITGKSLLPQPEQEQEEERDSTDDGAGAVGEDAAEEDAEDEPPPAYWGHLKMKFGPFLAISALEYLFFGPWLVERYFSLFSLGGP
jgi:leader peptidase (prepilin peptidase)/N-methyltransferase